MDEKKVYKCEKCDKFYKNYKSLWKHNYIFHKPQNSLNISHKNKNEIEAKKCICDKCNKKFKNLEDIKNHLKDDCRPSIESNNIYTFKSDTLGKYKYENFQGGDIYIIQTEFNLKGFYKIGVTTDLYSRLSQYRCGSVLEPKLHYYYPCKNIKETDKLLKNKLKKFNVKREIYKADNINDLRNAIKEVQKESKSLELEIIPDNKESDIIPCQFCNLYFTNKQDSFIHIKTDHKIDITKALNIPIHKNSSKDGFECLGCYKIFARKDNLVRHNKNCKNRKELEDTAKNTIKMKELEDKINEQSEIIKQMMNKFNEVTTVKNIVV